MITQAIQVRFKEIVNQWDILKFLLLPVFNYAASGLCHRMIGKWNNF